MPHTDHLVTTMDQLEGMYGEIFPPARAKEIDHVSKTPTVAADRVPEVVVAGGGNIQA